MEALMLSQADAGNRQPEPYPLTFCGRNIFTVATAAMIMMHDMYTMYHAAILYGQGFQQ